MIDSQIALADGRVLAYTDIGAPAGHCVFFFHGAPLSRLHLVPLDEQLAARGLRVVSPDRPGYGKSSSQPGRLVSDWPPDVAALADALGIGRFLVVGHSTGGAYALVCAAGLGDRVVGGAVFGGVTDMAWPDAWTGYLEGRHEIQVMRLADEAEALARSIQSWGTDGRGFLAEPFEWAPPDMAFLADDRHGQALGVAAEEAFRQGIGGYAQDVYLEGKGWPFDPGRITAAIEVVHGELDTLVPIAHSRHTADVIAGATLRTLPGHGHLSTVVEIPQIVQAIANRSTPTKAHDSLRS